MGAGLVESAIQCSAYPSTRVATCMVPGVWTVGMQDLGYELPRRPILGTWVNKGKNRDRSCSKLRPSLHLLLGTGLQETDVRAHVAVAGVCGVHEHRIV